jgi:hypothetical protein
VVDLNAFIITFTVAEDESINGEVDVYIIAPPSRLAGVAVNEINAF